MATLKLMRPDEKANQLAEMKLYLDGQFLGTLLNKETKQFAIPDGRHRLRARIDSQGSKVFKFTVRDADTKSLIITTEGYANSPEPLLSGTFLDLIIGGFLLLYYFTIGHNRYLAIKELRTF